MVIISRCAFTEDLKMMIAAGPVEVDDRGDCDTVASVSEGHAPFAVFNRTANPLVRAVLSSPLHPLLSRGLTLITVTGRRSGRRYTFPVGYRQDGTG